MFFFVFVGVNTLSATTDLTISYIGRLPRLNYVWGSLHPDTDGWPASGQQVIWQAVVKNWGNTNLPAVPYKWYLDDIPIDSGTVQIPSSDTASVNFFWNWIFARHRLKFVIDPDNSVPEEEELNNDLVIDTDAISVGLYVEQSVYDYFRQYQRQLPNVHSNSWEDWAHRQVRRWNQMFAAVVYPETPDGVLDRIRLDKITVVPDGALPLADGLATNNPNLRDSTVDLQWGFPATLLNGTIYANHSDISDENPFYYEGSLIHELGHARYLIDTYGFNVHDNGSGNTVAIIEAGTPIIGTAFMPFIMWDAVHYTAQQGLMSGDYSFIDRYSAVALNFIAGHRATLGNCNAPGNIGVFMQDLPSQNRLTAKDSSGTVLSGADIKVYRAASQSGVWYGKHFDNVPDMLLTADSKGQVLLGRCPFSQDGWIQHTYALSNGVIIVRAALDGRVGYGFLESSEFNLEYWRGHIAMGDYELRINMLQTTSVPLTGRMPSEFELCQSYPNPFNPSTKIQFSLPKATYVTLNIYNTLGQEVAQLLSQQMSVGTYTAEWNATGFASGIYYYRLETGSFVETKKLVFLR